MAELARVIEFPNQEPSPTCLLCQHALVGEVTYCRLWQEEIVFESLAAAECEAYEYDPEAR